MSEEQNGLIGQKNYSDLAEAKKGKLVPKLESTGYLSGFVLANPIKRAGLLHGRFRCIGPLYERTFLVADIELDENMSKPHLEIFKKYQTLFFFGTPSFLVGRTSVPNRFPKTTYACIPKQAWCKKHRSVQVVTSKYKRRSVTGNEYEH